MLQTSLTGDDTHLSANASVTIAYTVRIDVSAATSPSYSSQAVATNAESGPNDGVSIAFANQDFSDFGSNPDPDGDGDPTEPGENDQTIICIGNTQVSYPAETYYSSGTDPVAVINGLSGGEFSAPSGIEIDPVTGEIDLFVSIVNTYTITYSFGGSCPVTTDVNIELNAPEEPTVNPQITNNPLPSISGSANLSPGDIFTVEVNSVTYTLGDGNLSISGSTWVLAIPSGDEIGNGIYEVIASIDNGVTVVQDLSTDELLIDISSPATTILNAPSIVNTLSLYTVTIQFTEDINGFDITDITVSNGTKSNFIALDTQTFTVNVTPNGNGDIIVNVPAGAGQDDAGNGNTAAPQAITEYDATAPTTYITGEPSIVNSTDPYDITIEFSENVTGFVISDIVVANGSATDFTDNGDGTFSVEMTPDGNGDITVDVAAGVAQDAAGNDNTAATQAITLFDAIAPTADITGEPSIVNSTDPYDITIEFSETVTGFIISDIVVANGSATDFTDNGDGTFTVEITPDGNGDITVDIAAGVAQDAAENDNTAATQAITTFDATAPTTDITGEPTIVNSTDPYDITIEFSESVTGFIISDIVVANGSATDFTDNGDGTFTVEITPDGNGDITVDIAAGVAQDAAGNDNTAAAQAVTIWDTGNPSVDITGEPSIVNSAVRYDITIAFSEIVTGFVISDIVVANGSATSFTDNGDGTFTVEITPDGNEDITVDIAAGVAQDAAGNDNTAATQAITSFDATAPTADITGEPTIVNSTDPYDITIEFSENVTGFVISDIVVANGSATDFTDNGDGTFTVEITPDGNGDITVDIAAGVAQDAAGNDNTAATQAITLFDATAPTADITGEPTIVNSADPYEITIEFSEIVTGFDISDIVVANGSATSFTDNGDGTFTVEITPDGNGDITVDIAAGVAQDAAGNDNSAAAQAVTIGWNPSVDITGEPSIVNSTDPYDITIEFSEIVTGFVVSDIVVVNGSATSFTDNGDGTFSVEITPDGNGDITVDIAAGVAQDAAGNDNTAAAQALTIWDTGNPSVDITGEPTIVNSADPYEITIEFSENVTGFDISDIVVANGLATSFTDNGDGTFTVEITPDGNGDITIDIAAGVAQDAAGNDNTAAAQALTVWDTGNPSVDITGEPSIVNSTDPYEITIEFSEIVTGFDISDIVVANGTATSFTDNGDGTFTVEITPDGNGDITVDIAAGVAQDAAGNDNTAAAQALTVWDTGNPSVDITGEPSIVNSIDPYDITIEFSESVTGFDISDIVVANGSATSFTDNGDGTFTVEITPDGNGDITVDIAAGVAQDAAGNDNTAAIQAITIWDTESPATTIANTPEFVNSIDPLIFQVEFTESVNGFELDDILVVNGSVSDLINNGDNTYAVTLTPDGNGNITIDINSGIAQDAAGNGNTAAEQALILFSTEQPTVQILNAPDLVNSTDPYTVVIAFSEVVTGFELEDISLTNGAATDLFDNGDGTFSANIAPDGNGDITIGIAEGIALSSMENGNLPADPVTTLFDIEAPEVPTVNNLVSQDGLPVVTGTWSINDAVSLTIAANNIVYELENNIELSSDELGNWTLDLSGLTDPLQPGTYDIIASNTDLAGNTSTDQTSNELEVLFPIELVAPTVNPLLSEDGLPVIDGTWDQENATTLTAIVNEITYELGVDPEFGTDFSGNWTLDLSGLESPLPNGVYEVEVTNSIENGASATDLTANELTVSVDTDGDGVPDDIEIGVDPDNPIDTDGDGDPDYDDEDDDGDGINTSDEDINGDGDPTNDDSDGDGIPDYLDTDDDNDGIATIDETAFGDCDNDGIVNYLDPNPCDLIPGKGLTPNGDSKNPVWTIEGIEGYPNNNVQVFNRWGNQIFEVNGYNNRDKSWAGQAGGKLLLSGSEAPEGTYFYLIDLKDGADPLTGFIVLKR